MAASIPVAASPVVHGSAGSEPEPAFTSVGAAGCTIGAHVFSSTTSGPLSFEPEMALPRTHLLVAWFSTYGGIHPQIPFASASMFGSGHITFSGDTHVPSRFMTVPGAHTHFVPSPLRIWPLGQGFGVTVGVGTFVDDDVVVDVGAVDDEVEVDVGAVDELVDDGAVVEEDVVDGEVDGGW